MLDVFRRAWRDTKQSIGLKWQSLVHYLVIPGLTVLLLWFLLGKEQAMDEIWIVGCYLATAFLLFVFSILWNLWLAPYRMLKDHPVGKSSPDSDPEPFDVQNWEGISPLKLGDAACLWIGVQPHEPIENDKALAMFKRLSGAMMTREIHYNPGGILSFMNALDGKRPWPEHSQWVHTISLRRYADQVGDVPPFLQSVVVPQEPEKEGGQDETDA